MRADRLVLGSADELLADAETREPIESPGKSGASLERVRIRGTWYVVKHLAYASDWTLRASGCDQAVPVVLWQRGVLDDLPPCIRQPIVAVAQSGTGEDLRATLLMEDVATWLVPADDSVISEQQNAGFLDHLAAMHAAFWEAGAEIDVVSPTQRYLELSPAMGAAELARGSEDLVPRLVREGWPRLAEVAPAAAEVVVPLAHDPAPLARALAGTPQTFVHGNWKLDNLGTDEEGRTVLLDWETSGRGAAAGDLAWYLAINCRRLPVTKEASIELYRQALERHGIDTGEWWERQLALGLLGALVHFGWEKALGGYDDELAWWEMHAVRGAALLA